MSISRVGRRDQSVKVQQGRIECQSHCPYCGHGPLNGCSHLDVVEVGRDHAPEMPQAKPGDYTLCARCANWLIFHGTPLGVRAATEGEVRTLVSTYDPNEFKFYTKFREEIRRKNE